MDELIKIHSLSFKGNKKETCTAYQIEFSIEKFMWELNYTKKHLLKEFLKISVDEDKLENCFQKIATKLYESPQVICHRDFHSRNVMLKYDQVVIIDFQDARMGPPAYDLVSLFYDSYVELNQSSVDYLLHYYTQNFPHYKDLNLSVEEFKFFFDLQSMQRCFKACGSFASFKNMRDDNRYLDYIPTTLNRVVGILEKYPEYKCLLDVIESSREKWEQI
ncbi:MAG: phosphotransferase [Bdellovibrionales bacterium]|nr:phosphotransferase [Bdellovibrionales bacterium]